MLLQNVRTQNQNSIFISIERSSDCRHELNLLRNKLKFQYAILASTRDTEATTQSSLLPSGYRIKGTLVAHLHEHKSSVTKLTTLRPNSSLFASASTDGTVRLFDCNKLNGHQSINRYIDLDN